MNINNQDIFVNFFHEIQNQINSLVASSDLIGKCNPDSGKIDKDGIIHHANTIQEVAEIMRLHVTLVNIETNPSFFELQKPKPINLYDVFKRSIYIFKPRAKRNKIKFKIESENIPTIDILPIISIVPSIIFDNCIKYSPTDSSIYLDIEMVHKDVSITIQSIGPMVYKEEMDKLRIKGFRGENAKEVTSEGSGIGLHYLSVICDLCKIKLNISSDENSYTLNGMKYSNFKINLLISDNN